MSSISWITTAKLGIFNGIINNVDKISPKKSKKFWSFTNKPYICSPKVKETSFTHADVVKW